MFLGLLDPHPDPLVTSTDPDPAPDSSLSHKCVERTEIVKLNFNTKNFSSEKLKLNHETYFYNFCRLKTDDNVPTGKL
jgi:hypothetical protein